MDRAEARIETVRAVERTGAKVTDRIKVLPDEKLGDQVWGISCLSVASGRLLPEHKAEMGTQVLMGEVVRVWKRSTNAVFAWYLTQSRGWLPVVAGKGDVCPLHAGTGRGLEPRAAADRDRVRGLHPGAGPRRTRSRCPTWCCATWCGRRARRATGTRWSCRTSARVFCRRRRRQDYAAWKQARQPTAENIERTARKFIGRPYLWGGNSPKGFDCSGFTKTVFFLNGIDLQRDSSKQAGQGVAVPLDGDLSQLKKGDLLFFGHRARRGRPERVVHVGIYLGDKLFIHSSERVRISSLDPQSPAPRRKPYPDAACARGGYSPASDSEQRRRDACMRGGCQTPDRSPGACFAWAWEGSVAG